MAKEKEDLKKKKTEEKEKKIERKDAKKKNKLIYIGPNLYDRGLIHGKVFDYEPEHLIKSMPKIKEILIPVEEFTKNKMLINKKGSKYDILIKEFQDSL